jgi:predicted amidophosphoribosyltransferase
VLRPAADVIAYIPPDPGRLLRRGYHPAEGLARELGRRWELEVAQVLLRRDGLGRARQTELARHERLRNVNRAFVAAAHVPERVVVVDDVYTTGATAHAAASALALGGASRVEVVTFARTVRA